VRILAPAAYAERVAALGCEHRPLPAAAEFDPTHGRAAEDQRPYLLETLFGPALPAAFAVEVARRRPQVAVGDYLLRGVLCQGEAERVATVPLVHTGFDFHGATDGEGRAPGGWRWQHAQVGAIRRRLGLDALPVGPDSVSVAFARRSAATLVTLPRAFDTWVDPPAGVEHVGWIDERPPTAAGDWRSPWPAGDARPLVVVSMGTTYMHQERVVERIARALAPLDARVLVLSGRELAPGELALPVGVEARAYEPHATLLPQASAVVSHGGTGTLLAALAAGLPVVCLPLGRDQAGNARRVEQLGFGLALEPQADERRIRAAVAAALTSPGLRAAAAVLARRAAADDGEARAVATLERLADDR
jgi:hypothetical protein